MKLLLGQFLLGLDTEQELLGALQLSAVKSLLFALDLAKKILLDAVGQILGHLRFGSAEEEGAHARGQAPARQGIALGIIEPAKLSAAAQDAGHGESHQAPEVEQAVFDRRARQHQAVLGSQRASNLRGLRIGILYV